MRAPTSLTYTRQDRRYILPKVFPSAENELSETSRSRLGVLTKQPTIAIDGPAASGKTTVGRLLARRLGLRFLDTGIMYRALAWTATREGVPLSDGPALGQLAGTNSFDFAVQGVDVPSNERDPRFYTPEVDSGASQVAQWPEVRLALVRQQQDIAARGSIVMVGRDIGTIVSPGADLKVFLVASPEVRARRRALQDSSEGQAGGEASEDAYARILTDIVERDQRDTQRSHSPLIAAEDAHRLDTEGMDVQQVVDRIMRLLGDC